MGRGKAIINLWDSATAVASTSAITSGALTQGRAMGRCGLLVIPAGSSPSVDITMTVGTTTTATFYTPYNTNGVDIGIIYKALASNQWIQFTPVLAPYFKITITGDSNNGAGTTIKAYLIFEEEL